MMPTGTRNLLMELLMGQVQAEQRGAEVEERTNMLPLVRYNDGTTGLGVPGAVYGPAQSAYNMLTTDRLNRALMGDDQAMQQSTRDSFDAASLAAVGGLTMPKPTNSLGMFGGRMAKTADHAALAKAEDMAARGVPREQIWDETGWFQGVDGKWRFEIDDSNSRLTKAEYKDDPLGHQMQHADLYASYPDMRNISSHFSDEIGDSYGQYTPFEDRSHLGMFDLDEMIKVQSYDYPHRHSIALHEAQHAIQGREGFAQGGSSKSFSSEDIAGERSRMAQLPSNTDWTSVGPAGDLTDNMIAHGLYQRLAGEAEARAVQARRELSPEQRRARAPWLDYDVPESEQIVRFR